MREQILTNIRIEIRNFLLKGTQLPKRDSRWESDIARILKEETINIESELKDSLYQVAYDRSGLDLSFEEWLDICKKLYLITPNFTVTSMCKGPDHLKIWNESSLQNCHKRIIKLIKYKYRDHFKRGMSFFYLPEST